MPLERYPYVVIFIPAYNEADSIGAVIEKIKKDYIEGRKQGYWTDIIVVDDGSADDTAKVAKSAGVKTVISHTSNRGLGASTRTGMQRAYEMGADVAVKIDADFQHDPDDIDKVIRPVINDEADCVFGSRFKGGLGYRMPFYRAAGNRFFSWVVRLLTGLKITDSQTGLMAFGRRYLKDFEIISDYNETQQLIIDAWARHMRIIEVPVVFKKREKGTSFISWRYPFKVLPTIARLFAHINPLVIFLPVGLILTAAGILLGISILLHGAGVFGDATMAILIVGGIQLILFGLLADLMSKKR
ncbi:MAG: glycosyltransferase family 2 protein [Candidatus Omnitrophica bacterium]|nr:glycosyltransferase family 2 protein [Candidatus Omnitrophota bacterium]